MSVRPDLFFSFYAIALVMLRFFLRKLYDKVSYPTFLLLCSFSMLGAMACLYLMHSSLLMLLGAVFMADS